MVLSWRTEHHPWSTFQFWFRSRPYTWESTGSRPISAVNLMLALLVLGWGTTWEYNVLWFLLLSLQWLILVHTSWQIKHVNTSFWWNLILASIFQPLYQIYTFLFSLSYEWTRWTFGIQFSWSCWVRMITGFFNIYSSHRLSIIKPTYHVIYWTPVLYILYV